MNVKIEFDQSTDKMACFYVIFKFQNTVYSVETEIWMAKRKIMILSVLFSYSHVIVDLTGMKNTLQVILSLFSEQLPNFSVLYQWFDNKY